MAEVTGTCSDCDGRIITVDPFIDKILFNIFGDEMAEHYPGCPEYKKMLSQPVSLEEL